MEETKQSELLNFEETENSVNMMQKLSIVEIMKETIHNKYKK